jgi:transcriptional regulator with XRE-family HTH domain
MTTHNTLTVLDRQLLLQLGDRLTRLRKSQALSTVELAKRVGISRTTLSAVESGDPAPTMGTYLRVMSALGISGELALLAGDTLSPPLPGTAAAQSRRATPTVQVTVTVDPSRHKIQDLQSIALNEAGLRIIQADPELLAQAKATLDNWIKSKPDSRSISLWNEWKQILADKKWRKVQGSTKRAQELRQASPVVTILPEQARYDILEQISKLKAGVDLGDGTNLLITGVNHG